MRKILVLSILINFIAENQRNKKIKLKLRQFFQLQNKVLSDFWNRFIERQRERERKRERESLCEI